jgi:metal-dependent amidase/aminoacylase/carboxypeptidase family protein
MSPFSPPFHGLHDHLVRSAPAFSAVRRDLHAHPELCFEEVRTSDVVARELAAISRERAEREFHEAEARARAEAEAREAEESARIPVPAT